MEAFQLSSFRTGNQSVMTMDIFRIILLAYVGYLLLIRLCSQGNIERMLTVTTLVNAG